jgi:hypothetical protein
MSIIPIEILFNRRPHCPQTSPIGRTWTSEEDALLLQLLERFGRQWTVIASEIPDRLATQVGTHWKQCLNPELVKGPFTFEEDQAKGPVRGGRSGLSCRTGPPNSAESAGSIV